MANKYGDIRYKWLAERGTNVLKDELQRQYAESLFASVDDVQGVFCEAASGTGKTTIATLIGAYGVLNGDFDRIIYLRNTEVVGEKIGFLPGDIDGKVGPHMTPFIEALDLVQPGLYEKWAEEGKAHAIATTHTRGVTWDRAYVIIDESQSLKLVELQTAHTRPTATCKIVTIGSLKQIDGNVKRIGGKTPFEVFMQHYAKMTPVPAFHTLTTNFRGAWSLHGDKVAETIEQIELEAVR